MIYLIVTISFVVFVRVLGVYAEAKMPDLIARMCESDLRDGSKQMPEAEYQVYAWAFGYHIPIVTLIFFYVVALQAEDYVFANLLAMVSLVTIAGLLAALKFLPPKETTP